MKSIIITVIILATLTLVVACTMKSPTINEVVVLRDITDKHLVQPDAEKILSVFNLENKWNGAVFRFTDLTNVSYNQEKVIKLEARNEWLSNEMDRDKEIKNFRNNISEIISSNKEENIGKNNSAVYAPIAQELNHLSQTPFQNKTMLIYSDLMENTNDMSFYDSRKLSILKSNPENISKYFETLVPLQNLKGIKIYIIFQPDDMLQDEQFRIVSGFYKKLFEDKGAEVQVSANLN